MLPELNHKQIQSDLKWILSKHRSCQSPKRNLDALTTDDQNIEKVDSYIYLDQIIIITTSFHLSRFWVICIHFFSATFTIPPFHRLWGRPLLLFVWLLGTYQLFYMFFGYIYISCLAVSHSRWYTLDFKLLGISDLNMQFGLPKAPQLWFISLSLHLFHLYLMILVVQGIYNCSLFLVCELRVGFHIVVVLILFTFNHIFVEINGHS